MVGFQRLVSFFSPEPEENALAPPKRPKGSETVSVLIADLIHPEPLTEIRDLALFSYLCRFIYGLLGIFPLLTEKFQLHHKTCNCHEDKSKDCERIQNPRTGIKQGA